MVLANLILVLLLVTLVVAGPAIERVIDRFVSPPAGTKRGPLDREPDHPAR